FNVAAIFIVGAPSGLPPVVISSATDIGRSLPTIGGRWPQTFPDDVALLGVWWGDRRQVRRLVKVVLHDRRALHRGGGLLNTDVATVTAAITAAARRLDVRLADHAVVMARVSGQVGKIRQRVEASRQNGTLQGFNTEFRRRRLLAQRTGARFPTYGVA